ncbi:hypothetical protein ASPZODRAFT_132829 [Penicilliopsis zonata CBS 506.65]|uniref:F-box domain-containing protein n=1 Tax=Penicilliopsis zonata CBS 506.65 TaxID=1073090 RepID=A0A1L9SHL6_9EURO|nr:hypothetical protein ASPZODRAFT_132829 [Penicilliopsis zonata CBS 506.65]OJJ46705.1 hypothetical protein ASPZODRAFT_132829 [Penicilliopsis zonata CBS 506.65]
MSLTLPGDVVYMILDLLRDDRDYNSIYQCAISSKYLCEPALAILYQLYDTSPVMGGGTEEEQFKIPRPGASFATARREEDSTIRKWALMWRSIILSTFDQTYLPYHSYIRYLDLGDLENLLRETRFTGRIREDFFSGVLQDVVFRDYEPKGNKRLRSSGYPDPVSIVVKFGGAIVKKTNTIRGLFCNVPPASLSEWIQGLPHLQVLRIWSGEALTQHAGQEIRSHCPNFKRLTVYRWSNYPPRTAETDSEMFLNELRPHTLEYFEVLSNSQLGPRSIRGFGCHLTSLEELKLTSLGIDAIAELASLGEAPALKVLVLTDSIPTARTEKFYEIIAKLALWIRSCRSLRRLELRRFVDDPALLSQVLTDEGLALTTLSLAGYAMSTSRAFHEALACQKSLQYLYLRGEGNEVVDENEALADAVGQLCNLRELELKDISDFFTSDQVMLLTLGLYELQRLWISGDYFEDSVWIAFLCLPKLQSLVIHALSEFTSTGIIDFVSQLGPGSRGMHLSILNAVTVITEESQVVIRDILKERLDGTFDFGLAREEYTDAESDDLSD